MADTQSLLKDLISTVEEKVNQPISGATQSLTSEFFSDPAAVRQRMMTENAANPLNPLDIDKITAARRGNIAGQLSGLQSLQGGNIDLLSNFFNTIANYAQSANEATARRATTPRYQLATTAEGYRAFNPITGQFEGGVIGQPAAESTYGPEDIESFAQGLLNNQITMAQVPASIRADAYARYQQLKASKWSLSKWIGGLPGAGTVKSIWNFIFGEPSE